VLHDAAPLLAAWIAGAWLAHRHRQRWLLAVFGVLLGLLALSLLPGMTALNAWLRAEHWVGLAAIVIAAPVRGPGPPRLASLTPMVLATQGFGALVLAAAIAGKALLEPGTPGRALLVGAVALLSLAALMDAELLRVWSLTQRLLGFGADEASLAARASTEAVRLLGWGALLWWGFGKAKP